MAKYYDVTVYKTFYRYINVVAESEDEARVMAYALCDNDDWEDLEYCDDENRFECEATETRPPEEWACPEAAHFFSREDVDDLDYEYAEKDFQRWKESWKSRNDWMKSVGVKEYIEAQSAVQ